MADLWSLVTGHPPERAAVTGLHDLTYADLIGRVEAVTPELGRRAAAGDVVALEVTAPETALVGMLAALRLGMAFLPLDTTMPAARRRQVLESAGARAVLTETGPFALRVSRVADPGPAWPLADPGYVMFTSGSTGRPKGVHVSARALAERLDGLRRVPGFGADHSFLALTAVSFDIALAETLLPMVTGGSVVAVDRRARVDTDRFGAAVETYRPAVVQATPSFWRLMLASGWSGRRGLTLWCGGEPMTKSLAQALLPCGDELWNLYGPTEATIWATAWRVSPDHEISLGEPLPGTTLRLFDGDRQVTGPGTAGEIVLSGAGLADGYLGAGPEQDPRFAARGTDAAPAYGTGDRARYRADRSLEFLGRSDTQVKLRGHRIELGEIEAVLEEHPSVVDAIVVLVAGDRHDGGTLAAAVTTRGQVTTRELRRWLADRLPAPMLPRSLHLAGSLPRTTAGKLDRVRIAETLTPRSATHDHGR
ncbi:AMP-binding protein [Nonomuraea sp. NN258]|uniref:AMP-binding protein n=1 Tax=Nonomuraea antri TaxID=2730852 RepID=UPI0015690514|nr:AMP-binding protein [Nonomuraea antri]NRQ33080.1 AMP-binding protein [Nonomuraea antri]